MAKDEIDIIAIGMNEYCRRFFVRKSPPLTVAFTDDNIFFFNRVIGKANEYLLSDRCFLITASGRIYLFTNLGCIFRSEDNGISWQLIEDGVYFSSSYQCAFEVSGIIFGICKDGIIETSDYGNTWKTTEVIKW